VIKIGTFTLSQTRSDYNMWLYPLGNGCVTDHTPSAGLNWQCVDEDRKAPNEDVDYVYTTATDGVTDVYTTDHDYFYGTFDEGMGALGAINYVQIYARGKSHLYPQHEDGLYKIVCTFRANPADSCATIYDSEIFDLTTGYSTLNWVLTDDPSTGTDWEWADLESLEIGIESSSPTLVDWPHSATFRPNAVGDKEELSAYHPTDPAPDNYECVDDATYNDGYDFVFTVRNNAQEDLYGIPNHTTEAGTITKVSIFYRTKGEPDSAPEAAAYIKTGGSEFQETLHDVAPQWTTYSYDWNINPDTAAAWTWADIDALQIGVQLKNTTGYIYCTQVYATVSYVTDVNPEIRTTQCYAKVNFNAEFECTLNKPTEVSVDHERNVKMLNFWSGNRAVYDIGRTGKTMVLTGTEIGKNACTHILCVRGLAEHGGEVTTSGTGADFDGTYRIASFGWKLVGKKPLRYDWILELEFTEL